MRALVLIVSALLLDACATGGQEQQPVARYGMLVVVSRMGDRFAIRNVGTTVFENKAVAVNVDGWRTDRHVEGMLARQLTTAGRSVVAAADPQLGRALGEVSTIAFTGEMQFAGGPGAVTALAKSAGADYVLVVSPSGGDPFFRTNQSISGYGFYQRAYLTVVQAINFVNVRATLLDGKTGAQLATTSAFKSMPLKGWEWMDPEKLGLTPEMLNRTKPIIEQLFEDAGVQMLQRLRLAEK
jgi:hypothetical protein